MSLTVCLAPAHTVAYPNIGGHFWVYLQWALGLRSLGCNVIWLEVIDANEPASEIDRKVATVQARLARWGLANCLALTDAAGTLPRRLAAQHLDLQAATEAELLVNLWHSLPAPIVQRFRRSCLIDTDPGLLQTWITAGSVRVAPHDTYFTIGETVGTGAARFPDCGLHWVYTPPAIFLPEWPVMASHRNACYTTVAHWWGGKIDHGGTTFWNEKRVAFLDYLDLPARARVRLEIAVCLAECFDEYRQLMEPRGWRVRESWEISSTLEAYRAYIQQSRGEFSCAKPAYVKLDTAWISDRTLCYLASGRPAVVQHTGRSGVLPDADGLFRFRTLDEAAAALAAVESDYERHCRQARALVEEHFEAGRVASRVLERALERPLKRAV